MSIENRGGRKLYYRVRRRGGRLVKEYVASGEEAEKAARLDVEAAAAARDQRAELRRVGVILDAVRVAIEVLVEQEMVAAGYHRHDRGPWRKRRVAT